MKKNRLLRAATVLLVLTLITSCFVGGTFAKYTTSATSSDTARVATWGFTNASTITLTDLFKTKYDNDNINGTADVIAPGSGNFASFKFTYDGQEAAPEVAYTFAVSTNDSDCAADIQANGNIKWALVKSSSVTSVSDIASNEWGTWTALIAEIKALSGDASGSKNYAPSELPEGFTAADDTYVVAWKWDFPTGDNTNDVTDTALGNKATLDAVTLKITITATQID